MRWKWKKSCVHHIYAVVEKCCYTAQKQPGNKYYSNSGNPEGGKCKQTQSMQQPVCVCLARAAPPFASVTRTAVQGGYKRAPWGLRTTFVTSLPEAHYWWLLTQRSPGDGRSNTDLWWSSAYLQPLSVISETSLQTWLSSGFDHRITMNGVTWMVATTQMS